MHLIIDNKEVDVPPGTTVKEAARRAGIKIPGLCDHPELQPYGGCRLCLVEIAGMRGYPSSCTLPASEGMRVMTNTPALQDLRKSILEMLLAEHPSGCLFCDRAGRCDEIREAMRKVPQTMGCRYCPKDNNCELQETALEIGLEKIELPHISPEREPIRSPFFDRDPNLCILCGRCVRSCAGRGQSVIGFQSRGFDTEIGTAYNVPLEEAGCRFCGECVDICPTGALVERGNRWLGQAKNSVVTTCPYCSSGCQIRLEVNGDRILRSGAVDSKTCVRGRFGLEFANRDRLRRPLVRRRGVLIETTMEEALSYAAQGLARYTGQDFALFASGVLTNEALYLARRFAENVMSSHAVAPDVATDFSIEELLPRPLLIVGDLAETNPALELALSTAGPLVISPIKTRLARAASQWLKSMPGQEHQLLEAMAAALKSQDCKGSAEETRRAVMALQGGNVLAGPDCSPEIIRAASELANAAGGKLCLPGRNCNSLGAFRLELNDRFHESLQDLKEGKLKAAYIVGLNPARESEKLAALLSGLQFLVVQDIFLTETARLANVVLPACSFAETDGSFTGLSGKALAVHKALPARGCRPDWQVISDLARRMQPECSDFGIPQDLKSKMSAPFTADSIPPWVEKDAAASANINPARPANASFILLEGPSIFEFGSGTRISKVPDLRYLTRERQVEIHPRDAALLGLAGGDALCIKSDRESFKARARLSRRVDPGLLRMGGTVCRVTQAEVRRDA
ncbi:Formate dehydrogenase subunit alpha [uncultured archaeon]|nr:Formate dehydrogenase subunit alpha [uncultured archaeon]